MPQSKYDDLKVENEKLKEELDDCKFGPEALFIKAKTFFDEKNFTESRNELNLLISKHPGSAFIEESKKLLEKVEIEIQKVEKTEKKAFEEGMRKEKERLAKATEKMRKKYDEMNDYTWYYDKSSPNYTNQNGFYCYIGTTKKSSPWMRLRIQYSADEWLFIEKYIIKVDGTTYTITEDNYGEIQTDNGSGGVCEWLDRSVDSDEYEIIKAISNGKDVKIRFVGKQYYKDKSITSSQKQGLKNVLDAFEALGGKY